MVLSKQGMLICHAIALTIILMFAATWKLPSSQEKLPMMRLPDKASVQPFKEATLRI